MGTILYWLMETQTLCQAALVGWVGGWLNKATMTLAGTLLLERTALPTLALKADNSVPPCLSLALFKMLSFFLDLRVSVCE